MNRRKILQWLLTSPLIAMALPKLAEPSPMGVALQNGAVSFKVTNIAACPSGDHVDLTVTDGQQNYNLRTSIDELKTAGQTLQRAEQVLFRLRVAILEANATTRLQVRNAILNQTFEI